MGVVVESGRSVRGMKVRSRLIKVKRTKVETRTCLNVSIEESWMMLSFPTSNESGEHVFQGEFVSTCDGNLQSHSN